MNKTIAFTDELYDYLLAHNLNETPEQRELRAVTAPMPEAGMQIGAEQAAFMRLLVKLIGAKRTLEIGVFTGYSSMTVALALPEDGRITACDVSETFTSIAREHWEKAGVAHKIHLHIAPGLETLDRLIADGHAGTYDFAFIDADKVNYPHYYERCLTLLRAGGLIAVDNTLWAGKLVDPTHDDPDTEAIRALNRDVHADARVESALVNVGDGMLLAMKK